jgi:hypothetical protein
MKTINQLLESLLDVEACSMYNDSIFVAKLHDLAIHGNEDSREMSLILLHRL